MNDFFTRLAARAVGTMPLVEPHLAPRFAPVKAPSTQADEVWWERMAELPAEDLPAEDLQTPAVEPAAR
jgi:hypothetical protein